MREESVRYGEEWRHCYPKEGDCRIFKYWWKEFSKEGVVTHVGDRRDNWW